MTTRVSNRNVVSPQGDETSFDDETAFGWIEQAHSVNQCPFALYTDPGRLFALNDQAHSEALRVAVTMLDTASYGSSR
jgi:hypothetical protein